MNRVLDYIYTPNHGCSVLHSVLAKFCCLLQNESFCFGLVRRHESRTPNKETLNQEKMSLPRLLLEVVWPSLSLRG